MTAGPGWPHGRSRGPGKLKLSTGARRHGETTVGKDRSASRRRLGHLLGHGHKLQSFKDVSGDPEAQSKAPARGGSREVLRDLRAAHIAEHQRLFVE